MKSDRKSLISAFDAILGDPIANEIPEGFFSLEQIARRQCLSQNTLSNKLLKLAKSGKCDRQQFRNENGRVCWFYRVRHAD
jgi:DNA-binding HxlR family transcriptional regulator